MTKWSVPIVLAMLIVGCTDRALQLKRQEWEMERQTLVESLDTLQARLLANQARVRLWQELRSRHEKVSAIACTNLDSHSMAIAGLKEQERDRRSVARRARVAMRWHSRPATSQ